MIDLLLDGVSSLAQFTRSIFHKSYYFADFCIFVVIAATKEQKNQDKVW